jgi:RNA polymerase sigma-70 factor (ECF subfamily)
VSDAEPTDDDLVLALGTHSQPALAEIYRRHGGAVWAVARRVCRDTHLAEDVTQNVFVELWTRPERFDAARASLRSWLLTQAHGRAVDLVRSESSRRRRQERDGRMTADRAELETTIYADELADDVRRAVESLPAAERQPILLAYFGGHTYREAAEMLGQPEGTVKSRIRSGLGALRRALEAEGARP